jgi:hypothetical protein
MQEIDYGMKNEIHSLIIERDILTKTIFRVYQQDTQLTKIQRDKLLTRYQHQLGVVVAQIEKLGNAMKHTDMNPSDEGMFAAMDQKLSMMDEKLQEISSQINTSNNEAVKPRRKLTKILSRKIRTKSTHSPNATTLQSKYKPLEIITLTEVPRKVPVFFRGKLNPPQPKIEGMTSAASQKVVKTENKPVEVGTKLNTCEYPNCDNPKFSNKHCSVHTDSYVKKSSDGEKNTSIPDYEVKKSEQVGRTDTSSLDNNELDQDDDDISKITDDIEKALSNLNQAEVE